MAIPSYAGDDITAYDNGEYLEHVANLVGLFGNTYQEVKSALSELRDWIVSQGQFTNIINTDGSIDLSKLTSPTLAMIKSSDVKIYGNPQLLPVYFGWEDGVKTLIFGPDAVPYIQMASMPGDQYIIPPNLVLLGTSGVELTGMDGMGGSLQTISFGASFMTIYGETAMSNLIQIGPILEWQSVTLGVITDDIPTYATSVIYYRDFGGTFRKVLEVKL
jgi:hypothetical protein